MPMQVGAGLCKSSMHVDRWMHVENADVRCELAVVLALAATHAHADAAMLGLQLGSVSAALVALQVAAGFLGRAHRGFASSKGSAGWIFGWGVREGPGT